MSEALDYSRIRYLLNPESLAEKRVTIVGLGSGGAPACDHLVMNGVRRWALYDPDVLDPINLVKHPRMRRDLGRTKVEIQRDWILDRNPDAEVEAFAEDVFRSPTFDESVRRSDLVLCCPDQRSVREFVSDRCVQAEVPFVSGSVFRTGIGGEVYAYLPGDTGCYQCLERFCLANDLNVTDEALGLTPEEEHRRYGLGESDFRASGLSLDIQAISLLQARMALALLLPEGSSLPRYRANWIIYANRAAPGIFERNFEVKQFLLLPQDGCHCQRAAVGREGDQP
jgi:molybdopterin/thiamine biosynthesis adenylyltransferase